MPHLIRHGVTLLFFVGLLGSGCGGTDKDTGKKDHTGIVVDPKDEDGDGVFDDDDCDDADPNTFPNAPEICDEVDNDCDGDIDEGLDVTWFPDADADGFGEQGGAQESCDPPADSVENGDDCDDGDASVNPDALEDCDPIDRNCDGHPTAGAVDELEWFADADGDAFGDDDVSVFACAQPSDHVADGGDCDDLDPDVNPDAAEICNGGIDDDCDPSTDEEVLDGAIWFADADTDAFGDPSVSVVACVQPYGFVADDTDCDDLAAAVNPAMPEICNGGIDDDCDPLTLEDDVDGQSWFADSDADGFGDPAVSQVACIQPTGFVADNTDCDDLAIAVNPAGIEICNGGIDDDCNPLTLEDDVDGQSWFADADVDGFGDPAVAQLACVQPTGFVVDNTDCDDLAIAVNPAGIEICNGGVDDDCDPFTLEDESDGATWFADADTDGFGDAAVLLLACVQPSGFVVDSTDCDDLAIAVNPAAVEICNGGIDDDCDPLTKEGDVDGATWFADVDTDGFGDPAVSQRACVPPTGFVADNTDCDDLANAVNPAGIEICNGGVDDDCNPLTQEDDTDGASWFADADTDGFGNAGVTQLACVQPTGFVADNTDCDDLAIAVNPAGVEICNGGVDDDCNPLTLEDDIDGATWFADADTDGFGDAGMTQLACVQPTGFVADNTDCDDLAIAVNPAGIEICNGGVDDDCDPLTLEDDADGATWFADADTDGFGDAAVSQLACVQPMGFVADNTDCDDLAITINPGANEVCNGGVDDDCDPLTLEDDEDGGTWFADTDTDGFGDAATLRLACVQPTGFVADNTDCDDLVIAVNPGANEVCNGGVDDDCNPLTLEDDEDGSTWFADADTDGFGDPAVSQSACVQPTGFVADNTDCDDLVLAINPGANEVCNGGVDDDCDPLTLEDDEDGTTWFADADTDGFGDPAVLQLACVQPTGFVADNTDCDDLAIAVNPAGTEICNGGVDDDCDPLTLEDDEDGATWFADTDTDGFGDAAVSQLACVQPTGFVADNTDCDDLAIAINPGANEVCNGGVDDDCDPLTLEDDEDGATWFADADTDGFGDAATSQLACVQPPGFVADNTDCDDLAIAVYPGANEVCNGGVDDDCDPLTLEDSEDGATWYADADTDGFGDAGVTQSACAQPTGFVSDNTDCDDLAIAVNPAGVEICNGGIDDDCDPLTVEDDEDGAAWFADADTDGFGDAAVSQLACVQPTGFVADNTDCDDLAIAVNPAGTEICNAGIDDDCDPLTLEDDEDGATWFADADTDGFGDASVSQLACAQPTGFVADNTDCDDLAIAVNPAGIEICNGGIDDDCDPLTLEDAVDGAPWFADADTDGFGDPGVSQLACLQPTGFVADNTDCDDLAIAVNPAGTEVCNGGIDDDCDLLTLEDDVDGATWFADADTDGFGDPVVSQLACVQPAGFVADNTDCDDLAIAVNPAGTEICNGGVDDDCDPLTLEDDVDGATWFADADIDGFGDPAVSQLACVQPTGFVADNTDCDDLAIAVNPAGTEVCNGGIDDDCDPLTLEDDVDGATWFADADTDGFGDASASQLACVQPTGFVSDNTDCDDLAVAVNPAAIEICNGGVDDDCNPLTDEDAGLIWYDDADGDGFGDPTVSIITCAPPVGFVPDDTDCDDTAPGVNPTAAEICNGGVDDDCDPLTDEDVVDGATWYADTDTDAFGDPAVSLLMCAQPAGFVADDTDCNDAVAVVNPAAAEICNAGVDDDCNPLTLEDIVDGATWYADTDTDAFGDPAVSQSWCNQPADFVSDNTDCNDAVAAINPAAAEICNAGVDDDCNPLTLEDIVDGATWYADADADTFGDPALFQSACVQPAGFVADNTDCNDAVAAIHPAAAEICNAGVDDDCDPLTDEDLVDGATWYADTDIDTYGDPAVSQPMCAQPAGFVADNTDCNDAVAAINPAAAEICNAGVDDDCDLLTDEDLVDGATWYADTDIDAYGDPAVSQPMCAQPAGFVADNTDCNDAVAAINPAAAEICNAGVDDDCDPLTDEDIVDGATWYADTDIDTYGDPAVSQPMCTQPTGFVADNTDCNDAVAAINPAAAEICNAGVDDDCDPLTDEDVIDGATWYADTDIDSYGDPAVSQPMCAQPAGFVADNTDCNDAVAAINPAAAEICNAGVDDDCDPLTLEDLVDGASWYADTDIDSYGDPAVSQAMCTQPAGFVADNTDCNDAVAAINPAAAEICNAGVDDDCDPLTDEDIVDGATWYADTDTDTFGDPGVSLSACVQPAGFVADNTDCNDAVAVINPVATEICNAGVDDDCDPLTDEDIVDGATWYADTDADTFGDPAVSQPMCTQPAGFVADNTDCNDAVAAINPAALEVCNGGVDDDCDPLTDESLLPTTPFWFLDSDADGYGDPAIATQACVQPTNYVSDNTDCDDAVFTTNPGAPELCVDFVDNDCDAFVDEACFTDHCGVISTNTTWDATTAHRITCDVTVQGNTTPALTILDGAEVYFLPDTSIFVGTTNYGRLDVQGTALGVQFTAWSAAPVPGHWDGLGFMNYDINSTVVGATIEYGGGNGTGAVHLQNTNGMALDASIVQQSAASGIYSMNGRATVSNTVIAGNLAYGFFGDSNSELADPGTPSFVGNTLTGNVLKPMVVPAKWAGMVDASSTFTGNGDDRIEITSDTIDTTVTWQAQDAPWHITSDVLVQGNTTPRLYIDDAAIVQLAAGVDLNVATTNYGQLHVLGDISTGSGVLFTSDQAVPAPGDWSGINLGTYSDGTVVTGATTEYGGGNGLGNISVLNTDAVTVYETTSRLSANDGLNAVNSIVLIADSVFAGNVGHGVDMDRDSRLNAVGGPTFTNNTLTDNGAYGISLHPESVGQLLGSSSFAGNIAAGVDIIAGTVNTSGTWPTIDDSYHVSGRIDVQGNTTPRVTIADATLFSFAPATALVVANNNYGQLRVDGTTAGVTFTSDQNVPAAGDWNGLTFGTYSDGSVIDGLQVDYAGANGQGAFYAINTGSVTVTNSGASFSSTDGFHANNSTVSIAGSTFMDNGGDGAHLDTNSALMYGGPEKTFIGNGFARNGGFALILPANYAGEIDPANVVVGANGTDEIGLLADTVVVTSSWDAVDGPYRAMGDIHVQGNIGPRLTINDGVAVRFDADVDFVVARTNYGTLDVQGTGAGVLFTSAQAVPAPGDWGGVEFGTYSNVSDAIGWTVEYGGSAGNGGVYAYSTEIVMDGCTLRNNLGNGFTSAYSTVTIGTSIFSGNTGHGFSGDTATAAFGFDGNVSTGNGGQPIVVAANSASQMGGTSTYTSNGDDRIGILGGTISTTGSWDALDVPYLLLGDIDIQANAPPTVTWTDGVQIEAMPGVDVLVGRTNYGRLVTTGNARIGSAQGVPAAGDWNGITFHTYDTGSNINGLEVAHAGANGTAALYVTSSPVVLFSGLNVHDSSSDGIAANNTTVRISGSTIANNALNGVDINSNAAIQSDVSATFTTNTVTGNGGFSVRAPANSIGQLDASSTFVGNVSPININGGDVVNAQTWQGLDDNYYVSQSVNVRGNTSPRLTIGENVRVEFATATELRVGQNNYGSLTVAAPIFGATFTSAQAVPAPGDWMGLVFVNYDQGSSLTGLTVEYGGASGLANLYFTTADPAFLDNVTSRFSATEGLYLTSGSIEIINSTFADNTDNGFTAGSGSRIVGTAPSFLNNVLTGNAAPAEVMANALHQLDGSSTFVGNTDDRLHVNGGTADTTGTWQNLDVPYRVLTTALIAGNTAPLITMEAGARMEFDDLQHLSIGQNNYGTLAARGTPAQPVTFTSASAAPVQGSWTGVIFYNYCADAQAVMDYVNVSYGGADLGGSVRFNSCNGTVTNSVMTDSLGTGLSCSASTLTRFLNAYANNALGDVSGCP